MKFCTIKYRNVNQFIEIYYKMHRENNISLCIHSNCLRLRVFYIVEGMLYQDNIILKTVKRTWLTIIIIIKY